MKVTKASLGIGELHFSNSPARRHTKKQLRKGCCQTNEPKHQYLVVGYFYEITKERHSVRAASRLSLNVLRFESDLCELNRL